MKTDTIAAIATGASDLGISIARISGDEAFPVIDKLYRNKNGDQVELSDVRSHMIHYGPTYDGDEKVDKALVLVMKGPHNYTAEDTVEIDCHGGILTVRKILGAVVHARARTVQPGEFTKRAFSNGRIDLSQAEAIVDVINTTNEHTLKSSVGQPSGSVSKRIRDLRVGVLYQIAFVESALDDPEHISLDGYSAGLKGELEVMISQVRELVESADDGRVMTEGVKTVILGKPNVGKSSLMNVLLGEERAIVTEIAGTTRDTSEEHIYLQGISLNAVDAAGIWDAEDAVGKIRVDRTRMVARDADLIMFVVDGSRPLDESDREIPESIRGKESIILLNKSDLQVVVEKDDLEKMCGQKVIPVSVKEEQGIGELELEIRHLFYHGGLKFSDQVCIINVYHKEALEEALKSPEMVRGSTEDQMPEDFYSIDPMDTCEQLGLIIGEAVDDDLVNEIFARFCAGKQFLNERGSWNYAIFGRNI